MIAVYAGLSNRDSVPLLAESTKNKSFSLCTVHGTEWAGMQIMHRKEQHS